MKKKIFSFIGTAFCSALMVSALSSTAFASNDISVKVDDVAVEFTDVKPIIENSRTFVPFRAIFEQMDAEVSWNNKTNTITAVRDDTTVSFTIGRQEVIITEDGVSETKLIDVAPFIRDNRTYVPIRFASEALGACVDWVSDTRTVLIVDVDKLMSEYESQFENIQKYINFTSENVALTGTFNNSITYKTAMGNIPVNTSGTVNGVKNNSDLEFSGNATTDINSIKSTIITNEGETAINSQIESMLNSLASGSYSAISSDNKLYLSGSVFTPLGLEENTWACVSEFNKDFPDGNFVDYLTSTAQTIKLNTNPNNTVGTVKAYLDSMKNIYGDNGFTTNEDRSISLNNNSITLKMSFDENKKISDAVLTTNKNENGVNISTSSHNTANTYDFALNLSGGKTLDINFALTAQKSSTNIKPTTIPNGDVIDIKLNY